MKIASLTAILAGLTLIAACGNAGSSSSGHDHGHDHDVQFPALETDLYWGLDTDHSRIGFTSIKSGEIIENHSFQGIYGTITPEGAVSVAIPLAEVETGIDQRNEPMQTMFFETEAHPTASIEATIDPKAYEGLNVGERVQAELEGTLSLHGVEAPIIAKVAITRIGLDLVEVASAEPVILYVEDFDLTAGLEALREIANLPAITPVVPVTFSFVFEAEHV